MKNKYLVSIVIFFVQVAILPISGYGEDVLSWKACIEEAKTNNPELISAVSGVDEKKADKSITVSAFYPQITSSLASSRTKTTTSSTGTTATKDAYSYGLSASQLVFDGLKTLNDTYAAKENIKASQESYRYVSSNVRLNLLTAFVNLLKAQENIKVAEEIFKIRRDNLILISLRYKSGLEHKGALMTAEANLAQADFELAQAKRNIEFTQRQLTKELGRKEFKPITVSGDFVVADSAKNKPNFEELVNKNPSYLQAVAKKNSTSFGIKSSYSTFVPELNGSAGTSKTGSDWTPRDKQWNAGLSLSWPIFEGGLRVAQVSRAQALYNQAVANEKNTKNTVLVDLEETWVDLQDALGNVDVQKKSLSANEERSKIAGAQYSTGFITFDNWIIIENDLVNAKKSYLNASAQALLAEANWIQAKGETLEYAL